MGREVINQTTELWEREPEKAKAAPTVTARTEGSEVLIESGPFTWQTSLANPLGGTNSSPSPTALLLGALAGCAAVFIRDTLAPQMGMSIDSVEAVARCSTDLRGLLGIGNAAPDLESIELEVTIGTAEPENRIQELTEIWLSRCPIYLTLTKPTSVKTSFCLKI